jgi:hypothetical protein
MTCINVDLMFGDKYRITFDPAYSARHVPRAKLDPWMMQVPCQGRGVTIYPHGADTLAVEVDRHPSIVARLKAIQGLKLHQDGDVEKAFLFNVSLFEQVAEVVKPRRRRLVSDQRRQELASYGRRYGFGAQNSILERAQTASGDLEAAQAEFGPLFRTRTPKVPVHPPVDRFNRRGQPTPVGARQLYLSCAARQRP